MTAYPVTCLVDYEGGYRPVITLEEPSDADTEMGAIARLRIMTDDGKALQVGLSPEAAEVLERRLRELRGAPESVATRVLCPCCDGPLTVQSGDWDESEHVTPIDVVRDLTESLTRTTEQAEKLGDSLHELQRWALPIDCPDCEGSGSQPPHSPEDGPCETCGGWTDAKRERANRVRPNNGLGVRCLGASAPCTSMGRDLFARGALAYRRAGYSVGSPSRPPTKGEDDG